MANGRRTRELVLWSTTAPSSVDVVVEAPGDTFVHLWNTWLDDGIEHAWLADAGMLVTTDLTGVNPSLQLSCSDGFAPASFDDLALSVEIIVPAPITLAPRKASVASG